MYTMLWAALPPLGAGVGAAAGVNVSDTWVGPDGAQRILVGTGFGTTGTRQLFSAVRTLLPPGAHGYHFARSAVGVGGTVRPPARPPRPQPRRRASAARALQFPRE